MIKPCPFCGNQPSIIMEIGRGHYIAIKCCIVNNRLPTERYTPERGTWYEEIGVRDELIKMWNTRV